MDGSHFVMHLHVDAEAPEEALRGLKGQIFRIFNDTADVLRQTAVGIGNEA